MFEPTQSTPLNATIAVTEAPLPFLTKNSSGSAVRLLQRFLVVYGYFKAQTQQGLEPVDGNFGNQTVAEVMKFQGDHSLVKDGQVSGLTWCAIAFPSVNPNVKGALRPIGNSIALPLLQMGDRGAAVYVLQRLLVLYSPKYIPNSPMTEAGVDGIFGAGTEAAVKILQTHHKPTLTPDGQVGKQTWDALIYPN
jgi:peptidoglycan hydrolase-like protein with peptidoglycan-binding domain